jgi:hypothetical protein
MTYLLTVKVCSGVSNSKGNILNYTTLKRCMRERARQAASFGSYLHNGEVVIVGIVPHI